MPKAKKQEVRVRIAPSPTGPLHIGTARTALFNWLFAKHSGGIFILRIEDTDLERSDPKYEAEIIEGLKWLGIEWDEGPYRQSERLDIYERYLQKLLHEKKAYYCYCSKEELEHERQAMLAQGLPPKYSGKCRTLSEAPEGRSSQLIRFHVPETVVQFKDMIRGQIAFDTALFGDIAIAKDIRTPLYNFAVVIDDYEMRITHVIRGEDHISNTPKQIILQKALEFPTPQYAHLPLILAPNRSKLSKRYAEVSLLRYREEGYLPDALVNFIAFLGWHPEEEKEILLREELVKEFDLKRVQKSGAIFNEEKLLWFNSQYIKQTPAEDLAKVLESSLRKKVWHTDKERLKRIIELAKERMGKLSDFVDFSELFFELPEYPRELLIWQKESKESTVQNLHVIFEAIYHEKGESFSKEALQAVIMPIAEERGRGSVLWPLRVALSGKGASPGPFEIMEILGKEETLARLTLAIQKLK